MVLEAYSSCPCGSGKKFKWCCQPFFAEIEKAIGLFSQGQHEAALRTINDVIAAHPESPSPLGYKARFLYQLERPDEADAVLDKAFEINPNYPLGYLMRGMARFEEGEHEGALILLRKAAAYNDSAEHNMMVSIHAAIGECELRMNRPLAARIAFEMVLKHDPSSREIRKAIEDIFGEESRFPAVARKEQHYWLAPKALDKKSKAAWQRALMARNNGRFVDAEKAFAALTQSHPQELGAWYNLFLTRARLGNHPPALEALEKYLELETDEAKITEAAALGEVLRCGRHMPEAETDFITHIKVYRIMDGRKVETLLDKLDNDKRLMGREVNEESQTVRFLILEVPDVLVGGAKYAGAPRFGASCLIVANFFQLMSPVAERLARVRHEIEEIVGGGLAHEANETRPMLFGEVTYEAMVFPLDSESDEIMYGKVAEEMAKFYEERWIHKPRNVLGGVPPVDAAGHPMLRKRLLGTIRFLEECSNSNQHEYDFDRLRRKLGLLDGAPTATLETASASLDIAGMGVAELAALDREQLADDDLVMAAHAASRLDAKELAEDFLKRLVGRPPHADRPDRYVPYRQLIEAALREKPTVAMEYVEAGTKYDSEHNQGRRQNEYDLWRGRIHAKLGEVAQAQKVFERLLERVPTDLKYRGTATEAMLSAKAGEQALRLAEQGLEEARKQQDRDSEEHFLELSEAAKKQAG